jgi:hypothetical protein
MGPSRIAPYRAQNIQRSYSRQQRVGERIAEVHGKEASTNGPASEVDISAQARAAAETARAEPEFDKSEQIGLLAERFVNSFLFEPAGGEESPSGDAGENGTEISDPSEGRTAFVRLLESYGLTIQQDESGDGEVIVNKETGDTVVQISRSTQNNAKEELLELTRNILNKVL